MGFTSFPNGITSMGVPVIPGIGQGIGLGKIYWVVAAKSSSNLYYEKLRGQVSDEYIDSTIAAAYAKCTAAQGDTVYITPGVYALTSAVTWAKENTHLIGTCAPPGDSDYYMNVGVQIYTDTATVGHMFNVTGNNCQFHNLSFAHNGAIATINSAVRVSGYGCHFYGCTMKGIMNTTQAYIGSCSVLIASGASGYLFDNCTIGSNTWFTRDVAYQPQVYYGGTQESGLGAGYGPQNGVWKDCRFLDNTTTITVPMIRVGGVLATAAPAGDEAMDRDHMFLSCHFSNWYGGSGEIDAITQVFDLASLTMYNIRLIDCSSQGYSTWRTARSSQGASSGGRISSNMPLPVAADSGQCIDVTT